MSELIEVKQIGEVEHIVHASGQWDGTGPVEFSDDGIEWTTAWAQTGDRPHPEYARVSVYRKDVRIPTEVTIRWGEQYPAASEDWSRMWDRSPMRHFGRTVRMVGFRQTFRDLLGDVVIEDEADTRTTPVAASAAPAPVDPAPRDWAAEIAAAQSEEVLDEVEKEARAARIFTPDAVGTALHRALRDRRRVIAAQWTAAQSAWDAPATADMHPEPGGIPDLTQAEAEAFTDAISDAPARPVPQDHMPPANRAARRKAARKKGKR